MVLCSQRFGQAELLVVASVGRYTASCAEAVVMNDLLLLVVRPGITRRVLKTTDLNEEDKDTEGQHSDQDLKQYEDKDVEQPNDGSCT